MYHSESELITLEEEEKMEQTFDDFHQIILKPVDIRCALNFRYKKVFFSFQNDFLIDFS